MQTVQHSKLPSHPVIMEEPYVEGTYKKMALVVGGMRCYSLVTLRPGFWYLVPTRSMDLELKITKTPLLYHTILYYTILYYTILD